MGEIVGAVMVRDLPMALPRAPLAGALGAQEQAGPSSAESFNGIPGRGWVRVPGQAGGSFPGLWCASYIGGYSPILTVPPDPRGGPVVCLVYDEDPSCSFEPLRVVGYATRAAGTCEIGRPVGEAW